MHAKMKTRKQPSMKLSPIPLFLLSILTISVFYAFFSIEAFAGENQRNDSKPLMVVAPISTDEWRVYLSDILRTKLTNKENNDKLQAMALDCSDRANTAIRNASTSSEREDGVRLAIRGHSLSWYTSEVDRANQAGEWKRLVQSVTEGRASFSKLVGNRIIDESEDNLTNVLDGLSSKAFLKKLSRLGTSKNNGGNPARIFLWEDKKGIHSTDVVSKLPPKFRDKYQKAIDDDASTELTNEGSSETFFWEDKKGIHISDDVSKLPPKNRGRYEKYVKQQKPKTEKTGIDGHNGIKFDMTQKQLESKGFICNPEPKPDMTITKCKHMDMTGVAFSVPTQNYTVHIGRDNHVAIISADLVGVRRYEDYTHLLNTVSEFFPTKDEASSSSNSGSGMILQRDAWRDKNNAGIAVSFFSGTGGGLISIKQQATVVFSSPNFMSVKDK